MQESYRAKMTRPWRKRGLQPSPFASNVPRLLGRRRESCARYVDGSQQQAPVRFLFRLFSHQCAYNRAAFEIQEAGRASLVTKKYMQI